MNLLVPQHIADARRLLCNSCEHRTRIGLCAKCGCVIAAKVKVAITQCPVGKWNRYNGEEE